MVTAIEVVEGSEGGLVGGEQLGSEAVPSSATVEAAAVEVAQLVLVDGSSCLVEAVVQLLGIQDSILEAVVVQLAGGYPSLAIEEEQRLEGVEGQLEEAGSATVVVQVAQAIVVELVDWATVEEEVVLAIVGELVD